MGQIGVGRAAVGLLIAAVLLVSLTNALAGRGWTPLVVYCLLVVAGLWIRRVIEQRRDDEVDRSSP